MAEPEKSSKPAPLPWVLLTGLLGVFAVGVPQTTNTPSAVKKSEEKKEGDQPAQIAADDPLKPVFDFHKSHAYPLEPIDELRQQIHGYKTEFLIATVPDPIDSSYGYAFDQVVDAIQRGVEKKDGYVLDRAWLPWELDRKAKPGKDGQPATILRETKPGIMLFRHGKDKTKNVEAPGLCVVFLVGETPTSGIHKQALHHALRIMTDVGHPETEPVRILGPYFSGSQTSLQFVIGDWWKLSDSFYYVKDPHPAYKFNIISGNATAIRKNEFFSYEANREIFPAWRPDGVDFSATMIPTRTTLSAMLHFLSVRDGSNTREEVSSSSGLIPGKVAILTESNTGFGKAALAGLSRDQILTLRFPLHISRVKNEYNQAAKKKDEQSGLVEKDPLLALSVADDQGPSEGIPSQGGSTTTATNGQVLSRILSTISREQCRYVGVVASDTRDKLFLIRLIRENCPDVRVFVTDGDLLLTHPDYRYYMRGVVIGSTYPLVPRNQTWVKSTTTERILFPSVGAQGYYNATLMHFGLRDQLLEYAPPNFATRNENNTESRPPIWISMVAPNGAIVPLHFYSEYEDKSNYVARREQGVDDSENYAGLEYPGAMLPISLGLSAWWGLLIFQAWRNPHARLFWKGGSLLQLPDLFYRNLVLGAQVWLAVPIFGAVWTHAEARNFSSIGDLALLGLVGGALILLVLGMIKPLFRRGASIVLTGRPLNSESGEVVTQPTDSRAETITWIVFNFLILVAVFGFASIFLTRFWTHGDFARRILFFSRAIDLSTGLSPLTPLMFLCAAYSAWGFFQLKRSHIAERFHVPNPYPAGEEFRRIHDSEQAVREEVSRDSIAVKHAGAIGGSAIALVGFGIAIWLQSLPTVEGWAWDLLFFTGFAGLFLLSTTTLIRLFYLWNNVKRLLDSIAAQPMMRAFGRLPTKVTEIFGKYLFAQKPQLSHLQVPAHQLRLLADAAGKDPESPVAMRELTKSADEIDLILTKHLLNGTRRGAIRRAEREIRTKLNAAAGLCIETLTPLGKTLAVDDAFGGGQGKEEKPSEKKDKEPTWVGLAESVAATQVVIYLSQFFVQMRNLVWAVVVTSSLLLMAATSYPFHPEKLLLFGLIALSAAGMGGVMYVLIDMNRDEVISRVTKSTPGKFSLDSGFIGSFFTYIVPVAGVLVAQLSGSFRWVLEPLLRVMK